MHMNDQELANLYESVTFHIEHRLSLFLGPSKAQMGSFNGNFCCILYLVIFIQF